MTDLNHNVADHDCRKYKSLALLAEALDKARQPEEALRVLEEALAMAGRNGERYYEAELHRLKGALLVKRSAGRVLAQAATGGKAVVEAESTAVANVESCFHESIQIAQRQKAKSLELRAVISIARLYQKQGKQAEAGGLLAQIYNRFSEGLDTKDLRDAKALLEDLSYGMSST